MTFRHVGRSLYRQRYALHQSTVPFYFYMQYAPDGVTYKFGNSNDDGDDDGGEFGRIIVTFVDALRRNTDQDRLAFGVRTSQRDAALVHVYSATSADFLHVDLVSATPVSVSSPGIAPLCIFHGVFDLP